MARRKPRRMRCSDESTKQPKIDSQSATTAQKHDPEERHLWYDFLKGLPITFNRQKVINRYIVDFYCAKAKLVIELDGSQHFEDTGAKADKERDAYLRSLGLRVLRYPNSAIWGNFEGVCEDILNRLSDGSTSSASLCSAPSPLVRKNSRRSVSTLR